MLACRMRHLSFIVALFALCLPLQVAAQLEVEPGVRVTNQVSAVEPTPDGPEVTAIHPTAIASDRHTGSNLARSLVYSGQHNTIEIPGLTSTNVLTGLNPFFYLHIDVEDPNDLRGEVTLLRLKPQKETRLALNMTANTFGGGRKRKMDEVAITKGEVKNGWLKLTLPAPLTPGEYGIMFLPKDTNMFADRVYDFTVVAK
jgi:hypothetical protein